MAEDAKVRFIFRKVEHPGIRSSIEALKDLETTGTAITYTTAAMRYLNYQRSFHEIHGIFLVWHKVIVVIAKAAPVFIMTMNQYRLDTFLDRNLSPSRIARRL